MRELVKVVTKDGKAKMVYKEEADMLERLGKLAEKVKERKTKTQTKEQKQPESNEDPEKQPMSKERNLKNVKSGD